MARKIIKAILFILAAVVVAGGIMTYLRSQKKVSSPLQTEIQKLQEPEVKHSEIKEVVVNAQGASAQVQIKGINEHNYNIQHIDSGDGFKILVPNAAIAQIQPIINKPHPLIKKIEVHPAADNVGTAELIFHTEKDVNFLDTQKNDTLTIDFIKTESSGDSKAAANAPSDAGATTSGKAGTLAGVSKSGSASSSKSSLSNDSSAAKATVAPKGSKAAKAASKKKAALAARAAKSKKSKKGSNVKLKPFVMDDDDTSLNDSVGSLSPDEQGGSINDMKNTQAGNNLSAFGDAGAPTTETIPQQQEETPTIEPENKPSADDNDGFNLKDVVKEEPKAPAGSANLLDAETQMSLTEKKDSGQKMAAIPNQQVDLNKLQANLPALQNMTVTRSGTSTVVTFDREKAIAFKVFRMVNPSRIVVDFKDAKSKLKPEYPRFAGTKISRIETREYAGMDGMLVRVIMYVDGAPNFTSTKNGNQLQIEVQ